MRYDQLLRLLVMVTPMLLTGCGSSGGYFTDQEKAYKRQQEATEDLEVPPDLSSLDYRQAMVVPDPKGTSFSEYESQLKGKPKAYASGGEPVLPQFDGIELKRDGNQRWLLIEAPPEEVWFRVVEFWRMNGLLLTEQNASTGVMTTDWLESRANVEQGTITEYLRKAFDSIYSSATRDQFRVRVERGIRPDTTEVFLTHRGLVEELVENPGGDSDTTYWTPRPNEPETESAMLHSLMVYLGVDGERATETLIALDEEQPAERAKLVERSGRAALLVDDRFSRAWRMVGVALDRVGFTVEDRDRSSGIYFVRYSPLVDNQEEGFFSSLAFWRDNEDLDQDQYQVKLSSENSDTLILVNDKDGQAKQNNTTDRILKLLHEQLR